MDVMGSIWLWVGFNLFVLAMLALDLGVFHRKAHAVSVKEATTWSVVWIGLAMLFNLGIYLFWDRLAPASAYSNGDAALSFFTGYLIEKSLSVDNIFVFVLIFTYFSVPAQYQHRVLFWGILGALLMRAALILVGAALIKEFHWILWIFGAFLIFTGVRMAFHKNEEVHPESNPLIRLFRRIMPVTPAYEGSRFFVRRAGTLMATPLFLVLLMVESSDLIFAVDSIPAIFAVTQDPFIVYTSNVFAILGLRSLYFLLAGVMDKFHYLKLGLSVVLTFVGVKMLVPDASALLTGVSYKIPTAISLGVVLGILAVAVVASLLRSRRLAAQAGSATPLPAGESPNH
ncbi:MAG: TerC family protein [Kouleothrix sp.]|nr:TerC family protein [Kouleothrix sp.]